MDDGRDKPIAFSSCTLAAAERKYSQIEIKVCNHLWSQEITILSDCKPLKHLFNESKATPTLASAHIQ